MSKLKMLVQVYLWEFLLVDVSVSKIVLLLTFALHFSKRFCNERLANFGPTFYQAQIIILKIK